MSIKMYDKFRLILRILLAANRRYLIASRLRRPAMMTSFPRAWNDSASPRPMLEPPPVIRILPPVVFAAI